MKAALFCTAAALVLLFSCQTAPGPIPTDASAEVYFQRAQTASDQGQYDEALKVYQSYLDTHVDGPHEAEFSARYEVAFLLAKKGQTAEALARFEAILADFEVLDRSSGAPSWIKVLSAKKVQELKNLSAPKK